jgi:hypothetical protein
MTAIVQPSAMQAAAAADTSAYARAGFWRRLIALSIDGIIVSVLFQLVVAVLFFATSGRVQIYGDLAYTQCSTRETVPEGLVPAPPAGSDIARECSITFFGAQTARTLQVARRSEEGTVTKAASRNYMLDRDGRPIRGVPLDWLAMIALVAYLVAMETRGGVTLGSAVMAIRVIDAAAPARPGVPLRKVVMRYLAMLVGALPMLAFLMIYVGLFGSLDELNLIFLKLTRGDAAILEVGSRTAFEWRPTFGSYWLTLPTHLLSGAPAFNDFDWLLDVADLVLKGWAVFLVVQIARKRDPAYDRIASTAVVLDWH